MVDRLTRRVARRISLATRHFSLVFFVLMHVACLLVFVFPPTWPLVTLFTVSYVVRIWAITVGFHRYFAHRTFRTSRTFQFLLGWLGCTAMENGPLWWASWHRRHHKHVDTAMDPHTPTQHSFWYAHIGWVFDPANDVTDYSNVRDLSIYPELRWLDRTTSVTLVAYGVGCYALLGWAGVVWGAVVSTLAVNHATFCINSLAHTHGARRYETPDNSRNNAALALLTLGEGWHNNHHHYMSSARQGFAWWEIDAGYYSLRLLATVGLVRDIREPPEATLQAARSSIVPR